MTASKDGARRPSWNDVAFVVSSLIILAGVCILIMVSITLVQSPRGPSSADMSAGLPAGAVLLSDPAVPSTPRMYAEQSQSEPSFVCAHKQYFYTAGEWRPDRPIIGDDDTVCLPLPGGVSIDAAHLRELRALFPSSVLR
jgi:hypothetical protein